MLLVLAGAIAVPQGLLAPYLVRLVVTLDSSWALAIGAGAFMVMLGAVFLIVMVTGLAIRVLVLNILGVTAVLAVGVGVRLHLWWALISGFVILYAAMLLSLGLSKSLGSRHRTNMPPRRAS